MGDYVPSTDGVRDTYVRAHRTNVVRAEFDRWLSQVKADVWEEAIAAQLETQSAVRGITIQIAPNPYREERQ